MIPTTDQRRGAQLRRARGLWTLLDVAVRVGIPKSTFHEWVMAGQLPQPSLTLPRRGSHNPRRYYSTAEVEQIMTSLKQA
jgi:predicted DNA-binding transcriptional regulator AlpA